MAPPAVRRRDRPYGARARANPPTSAPRCTLASRTFRRRLDPVPIAPGSRLRELIEAARQGGPALGRIRWRDRTELLAQAHDNRHVFLVLLTAPAIAPAA